jgi:hypothetical protein
MEPVVFHGELVPPAMSITRRPYPVQGPGTIEVRAEGLRLTAAGRRTGYGALGCVGMIVVFIAAVAILTATRAMEQGMSPGALNTMVGVLVIVPWIAIWFGTTSLALKAGPVGTPTHHDIPWSRCVERRRDHRRPRTGLGRRLLSLRRAPAPHSAHPSSRPDVSLRGRRRDHAGAVFARRARDVG